MRPCFFLLSCKVAIYCSQKCQSEDWCNNHQNGCTDLRGLRNGAEWRKARRYERNVSIATKRVFYEQLPDIVSCANSKGFDITNCCVFINLQTPPPKFELIVCDAEYLSSLGQHDIPNGLRQHGIESIHSKESVLCVCVFFDIFGNSVGKKFSAVHGGSLPGGSWAAYQKRLKEETQSETSPRDS